MDTPTDEALAAFVRHAVTVMVAGGHTPSIADPDDGVVEWAFMAVPDGPARCPAWDAGWLTHEQHKPCERCNMFPRLDDEEHKYVPPPTPPTPIRRGLVLVE